LILPHGYREAKPTMDSIISSLFPIEKVTKEEFIEVAFLSSVSWSCKDMNIIGEYDCFEKKVYQHPQLAISNECGSNKYMKKIQYVLEIISTK